MLNTLIDAYVRCLQNLKTIGLLGKDGGSLKRLVGQPIVVDSTTTARIQESHIFILHYWAWWIEQGLPCSHGDQG